MDEAVNYKGIDDALVAQITPNEIKNIHEIENYINDLKERLRHDDPEPRDKERIAILEALGDLKERAASDSALFDRDEILKNLAVLYKNHPSVWELQIKRDHLKPLGVIRSVEAAVEQYIEQQAERAAQQQKKAAQQKNNGTAAKGDHKNKPGDSQNEPYVFPTKQEAVLYFNKQHAVVSLGSRVKIIRETPGIDNQHKDIDFLSQDDMKLLYANRQLEHRDEKGNTKLIPAVPAWIKDAGRRTYHQIVFEPEREVPDAYNLWQGWAIEPAEGDCSLYLEHIRRVICSEDEMLYRYVIAWMADAIQRPADRPGVALVLRGKRGAGKGAFVNIFGALYGAHFKHVSSVDRFLGKFNYHLKDCLLVFADEAVWAGDKKHEGTLKAEITEKYRMIEKKGVDSIQVKNLSRYIFASNESWVIPAGMDERRFCVLDVNDAHMQDGDYFESLFNQMDKGGLAALLKFLREYNYSDINLRRAPETIALIEQKIHSFDSVQSFWFERLQRGTLLKDHDEWECEVSKDRLYAEYLFESEKIGIRKRMSKEQFGIELTKLCPFIKTTRPWRDIWDENLGHSIKRRIYCYEIPSLAVCRNKFAASFTWQKTGDETGEETLTDEEIDKIFSIDGDNSDNESVF